MTRSILSNSVVALSFALSMWSASTPAQAHDESLTPAVKLSVDACARQQGSSAESRIVSCTDAMKSSELLALGRADAHLNRGEAYMKVGDLERALADYHESVRLRRL
jgi:hypothetical protein